MLTVRPTTTPKNSDATDMNAGIPFDWLDNINCMNFSLLTDDSDGMRKQTAAFIFNGVIIAFGQEFPIGGGYAKHTITVQENDGTVIYTASSVSDAIEWVNENIK